MEAKEIYEGIARAVEAAKPSTNYCFFWIEHWSTCLTKSEWASWIQAFGILSFLYGPWIWGVIKKRNLKRALSSIHWKIKKYRHYSCDLHNYLKNNYNEGMFEISMPNFSGRWTLISEVDANALDVVSAYSEAAKQDLLEFNSIYREIHSLVEVEGDALKRNFYALMHIEEKCLRAFHHLDAAELEIAVSKSILLRFASYLLGIKNRVIRLYRGVEGD